MIVEALLDAITMRPGTASVAAMTNQRPASRSYFTFGPKTFAPARTGVKNALAVRFSTWSAEAVAFEKLRMRPLAARMNCDGPAAPLGSGGSEPVSPSVAPTKFWRNVAGSEALISSPTTADSRASRPGAVDFNSVGLRTMRRRSSRSDVTPPAGSMRRASRASRLISWSLVAYPICTPDCGSPACVGGGACAEMVDTARLPLKTAAARANARRHRICREVVRPRRGRPSLRKCNMYRLVNKRRPTGAAAHLLQSPYRPPLSAERRELDRKRSRSV